mmetsp:Transcript_4801/g.7950  ORF Transcript_4801/g.7950 Transcript_4801/m.7950 type:complete len:210 (-) Transcript_4801:531-1160(-)
MVFLVYGRHIAFRTTTAIQMAHHFRLKFAFQLFLHFLLYMLLGFRFCSLHDRRFRDTESVCDSASFVLPIDILFFITVSIVHVVLVVITIAIAIGAIPVTKAAIHCILGHIVVVVPVSQIIRQLRIVQLLRQQILLIHIIHCIHIVLIVHILDILLVIITIVAIRLNVCILFLRCLHCRRTTRITVLVDVVVFECHRHRQQIGMRVMKM